MKSKKTGLLLFLLFVFALRLPAQNPLDGYLKEALQNNLVLKDRKLSIQKSTTALQQARSLFLPAAHLDAQYLLANGGRSIDIPVGSLMNPVYSSLNQLTNSNKFPMIGDVSEQLNPNNFYDVRIKTVMPLYNRNLGINRDISGQQITMQEYEVDVYKRELVKDVKTAYYNFLTTAKAVEIYKSALEVVNQNLKVNQSLLRNGKGLPAYVSRAEAEVKQVEIQLQNALNDQKNAQAYFNFLLNRPLDEKIISSTGALDMENDRDMAPDISQREELKKIGLAKEINDNLLKMNKGFRTPQLNAFLDLGAQGFNFEVKNKSFFYLGGLQLKMPLFAGRSNLYKITQSELDAKSLSLTEEITEKQLRLAATVSMNNIDNALNAYYAVRKQEESARKYFQLINRGFQEGVNSLIEFLDARNQLTTVQLQLNIQQFKVLSAIADHERQTASYSFK